MKEAITAIHIREAALVALSGRIARPPGVEFGNYANLKIGVRAALAERGLCEPQLPFGYMADDALTSEQEIIYKRVYDGLVSDGVLNLRHGTDSFTAKLLPDPFAAKWQFLDTMGRGGQGEAGKVQQVNGGTFGVLKVPHSRTVSAIKRFQREVAIIQGVRHAAIVRLLDVNLDANAGELGYVTPLGIPLDKYWPDAATKLKPKDRYDRAYRIVRRMAEGLMLLHDRGVLHRDLKPENVVMIDDEPVIIDFGVALRPEDERISVVDQRVVANSFATPPAAHYGLHDEVPAWDCLGLAWIYGYLLGEGQKPKQFHWRFHPLVEEPRRDRAKAILAACSHERTIPKDAETFLALLDQYRLGDLLADSTPSADDRLRAAEEAHANALAAAMTRDVDQTEFAEVCIEIIDAPLTETRAALNRACVGSPQLPVSPNLSDADPRGEQIVPSQPMRQILQRIYEHTRQGYNGRSSIFTCRCGTSGKHFDIRAEVAFSAHYSEEDLPFRLALLCKGTRESNLWPDHMFTFRKDGSIRLMDSGEVWSPERIAALAYQWITEPRYWDAIGRS